METYQLYNNEITLTFDPLKHLYLANGKRAHGVTSCLNVVAKPAILFWGVNMACESMARNIQPGVAYDEIQIKTFLDEAKKAHTVKKEKAADKGTFTHSWVDEFIKDKAPAMPINEELRKSVEAFLSWRNAHDVEFLHSEVKVYSKKYNYAGTCDFIARVNGELIIGDLKTSSGIYNEMGYQVAAYQQARQEEYPEENYKSRIIVRAGKDGSLEIRKFDDFEKDFHAFLGALSLYERSQELRDVEYQKLL